MLIFLTFRVTGVRPKADARVRGAPVTLSFPVMAGHEPVSTQAFDYLSQQLGNHCFHLSGGVKDRRQEVMIYTELWISSLKVKSNGNS